MNTNYKLPRILALVSSWRICQHAYIYNAAGPGLNPSRAVHPPFRVRLIMSIWKNLGEANYGTPDVTRAQCVGVMGPHPPQTHQTEISTGATRSSGVCLQLYLEQQQERHLTSVPPVTKVLHGDHGTLARRSGGWPCQLHGPEERMLTIPDRHYNTSNI